MPSPAACRRRCEGRGTALQNTVQGPNPSTICRIPSAQHVASAVLLARSPPNTSPTPTLPLPYASAGVVPWACTLLASPSHAEGEFVCFFFLQAVITAGKEEVLNERLGWAHLGRRLVTGCSGAWARGVYAGRGVSRDAPAAPTLLATGAVERERPILADQRCNRV